MQKEYTFKITEQDHREAQRLNMRPRKVFKALLLIILLLTIAVFIGSLLDGSLFDQDTGLIGAFGIYIWAAYQFILPFRWKKIYQNNKLLQKEQNHRFEEDGIYAHNENGTGQIKWSDLLKWKEGKGGY